MHPFPLRAATLSAAAFTALVAQPTSEPMNVNKVTPIMVVESVEPCLPFWTDRLGFEVTASVPHEDSMGFAMLESNGVQIMYQSRASVAADLGAAGGPASLASELDGATTTLFIEIDAIDDLLPALDGVEVVVGRRQTFYGMDEIFVRAPCGTLIGFAAPVEGAAEG